MEGNARFDVLEGCSAHHVVKLLSALIDAINSEVIDGKKSAWAY